MENAKASPKYGYGIETDALDDLTRLKELVFFLEEALCDISICAEREANPSPGVWQGLWHIVRDISDRLEKIEGMCGRLAQ